MSARVAQRIQQEIRHAASAGARPMDRARTIVKYVWSENEEATDGVAHEMVRSLTERMVQAAVLVLNSEDPRIENRKKLCAWANELAKHEALVIEPVPGWDPHGICGRPGVTGTLKPLLLELARVDHALCDRTHGFPAPWRWEEVWHWVLLKHRMANAWAKMFRILRVDLDDARARGKMDWYIDLLAALVAWHEHKYRRSMGLAAALDETGIGADSRALLLLSFVNGVIEGARDPEQSWRHRIELAEILATTQIN